MLQQVYLLSDEVQAVLMANGWQDLMGVFAHIPFFFDFSIPYERDVPLIANFRKTILLGIECRYIKFYFKSPQKELLMAATMLDPRFKALNNIPVGEHNEYKKALLTYVERFGHHRPTPAPTTATHQHQALPQPQHPLPNLPQPQLPLHLLCPCLHHSLY
eukprot:Phypoly_transcript_20784.p1 GENE.Phypoly_transcript_20784~~Phypoly_transcript_20784.p1  ORF type:complete len:160 (+),score=30.35 Phypoly_transcript_20784:2-481(+)